MNKLPIALLLFLLTGIAAAKPAAPRLHLNSDGVTVQLSWTPVKGATGYRLLYAPYPYQGPETIGTIDVGTETAFSARLWEGAAYYAAIQAHDANGELSDYSNIGFVLIQDRGQDYRNYWRTYIKDSEAGNYRDNAFLYADLPDTANCQAGALTDRAKQRLLDAVNQIRALVDLPPSVYEPAYDDDTQAAALIQAANHYINHFPAATDRCYTEAGAKTSSTSNLHSSSQNDDPAGHAVGWTNDANNISNIAAVGHRRWILNPFTTQVSYGQVFGYAALKVFDFANAPLPDPATLPNFVAFPYGKTPYVLLSPGAQTPWSLSILTDKTNLWGNQHDYFARATVTVRNKMSGETLTVGNLYHDTQGSGIPNVLTWTVDNWEYDTWYTVTIEHIDYPDRPDATLEYDVFIDYKNLVDLNYPLEPDDQANGYQFSGTLPDNLDQDSYQVFLEGEVQISGTSQFSNMAFFIRLYDADKRLIRATDQPLTLNLPSDMYTLIVSNCNGQGTCYTGSKSYHVQIH